MLATHLAFYELPRPLLSMHFYLFVSGQAEKAKNQERDGVFRVIETQESAEVSLT